MEIMGITSVAAITVICYVLALVIKATTLDNKWLPAICGLLGGALGVAAMYIMPDYPAGDMITAVAIGIVSGLAATGVNQVFKQLGKGANQDADH